MISGKERNGKAAAAARHVKGAAAATSAVIMCLSGASADMGGPVPPGMPIDGTDFCVVPGLEYSGRWSIPGNGINHLTIEACALACQEDPQCTGATWINYPPEDAEGKKNCWFKAWDPTAAAVPCQPGGGLSYDAVIQSTGDCANIVYNGDPSIDCGAETEQYGEHSGSLAWLEGGAAATPGAAMAPALPPAEPTDLTAFAALVPPYTATPDADYGPAITPPPMTPIVDLGEGMMLATAIECAEICTGTVGCNSASWYGDLPADSWPGGDNCYLKTIEVPCIIPADAAAAPGVIWLMKQDACDAPVVAAPMAAPVAAPMPMTPMPEMPMPMAPMPEMPMPAAPMPAAPVPTVDALTPTPSLTTDVPMPAEIPTPPPTTSLSPPDTTLTSDSAASPESTRAIATDAAVSASGVAAAAAAVVAGALLLA